MESSANPTNKVAIVTATDGPTLSVVGDTYRLVMTGDQTGGSYAVIDMLIPPQSGPGPHSHAAIQEAFYVMEGEIFVHAGDQSFTAKTGTFINIPLGGVVHSFKNVSDSIAHLLCIVTPAGMDDFFREIGKPVAAGTFLPPPVMSPDEQKSLQTIAKKYGQKLFPPDYFG